MHIDSHASTCRNIHVDVCLCLCSCLFTTKHPLLGVHRGDDMLNPHVDREPRDLAETLKLLKETLDMQGIGDAQKHVEHLSLHPYLTAVIQLKLSHCFLFNRYDSLHVLDGGITSRIIVLVGNWLYYCSEGYSPEDGKGNEKWVRILNKRLAALARVDDFTHFTRPLLDMDTNKKAARRVKHACNWRCTEFEQLVQQIACVVCTAACAYEHVVTYSCFESVR